MITDILGLLTAGPTKTLIGEAGKLLGESESGLQTAVGSLMPALLGGMMQKAATPTGAGDLFKLISGANVDTNLLGNLAGALGGSGAQTLMSLGSSLASGLLGEKSGGLASALASAAGIKPSSAISLLGMATPMLFSVVKKLIGDNRLDAGGLADLLLGQKEHLSKVNVDPRVAGALGASSFAGLLGGLPASLAKAAGVPPPRAPMPPPPPQPSFLRRILPWLAALIAAWLVWQCAMPTKTAPDAKAPAASAPAPAPAPAPAAAPAPAPVPAAAPTPAATTASLPVSVFFETGSAAIGEEDKKAIATAAAAVKAGTARVDLTGYTDKTGDPAKNEELAKERAMAVRQALVAAGVPESAIGMKPPAFVTGAVDDRMARRVDIVAGN
jgi:outer membrane protein OmpA-like peptidoglycan-associated protein